MKGGSASDHYSYSHYADPRTARTFDERRFGGPIGELIAESQARVLTEFAGPVTDAEVLDVGTGTGRAALLLARAGARVTAIDASEPMLAVAQERAAAAGATVRFQVGDAHALEFGDRSFDAVICLRVLMHSPRWPACVAELCRVSRRLVIVDYPSAASAALLQSAARHVAARFGMRTEPYRVFTDGVIASAFERHGFRVRARHRQFVLPIAWHKALGSRKLTVASEHLLDRAGLLGLFGSPVSIVAERCASS